MDRHIRLKAALAVLILLVTSALACNDGGGETTASTPVPTPTQPITGEQSFSAQVEVKVRYYTKVPTAFYHLLGRTAKQQNFASFTIINRGAADVTVKVLSEIKEFTDQAVDTVKIPAGQSLKVEQTPIMKPGVRARLNEGQVAAFYYKVTSLQNGRESLIVEKSVNVEMMSKRDLVVAIVDENGDLVADFREYVVAWVTPASPSVEALLRQAAEFVPGEAIFGYQGDEQGVLAQLAAVYKVINDVYQVRYVNTPVSLARTDRTFVQRIRLPAETIAQKAGNCIETTALYASAIEAMDMNPLIILVPGHAFVACETSEGSHQYIFIETTVLGSGRTFDDALAMGQQNWVKYQGKTMLIDVRHWRSKGIKPMPEE